MKINGYCRLGHNGLAFHLSLISLLALIFLVVPTSHAVTVDTQLTSGPIDQFSQDPAAVSDTATRNAQLVSSGSANVGTGIFRTFTETSVEPNGSGGVDDYNSQARANMDSLTFNWGDPLGMYDIGSGQIGIDFDAMYSRDSAEADSGQHTFSLELFASLRDATGSLGFSRARIIHTVNFDSGNATDSVNNLSGGGGLLGAGMYVESARTTDNIIGSLLMPSITLMPGQFLTLSVTMFNQSNVSALSGTQLADWPQTTTDGSSTAQLFANLDPNPNLTTDASVPLDWMTSTVPIPGAVWLFGSGFGLLGWLGRRSS